MIASRSVPPGGEAAGGEVAAVGFVHGGVVLVEAGQVGAHGEPVVREGAVEAVHDRARDREERRVERARVLALEEAEP